MRLDQPVQNEKAKPKDWGFGKSKNKGTNFFWMEFVLPEFVASNGDNEVTIRKDWFLTDNTIDYVLRDLAVLGWHGRDIVELDKNEPNSHSFYDAEVLITAKSEEYENDKGEKKSIIKVQFINDPNYAPIKPLDKPELKTLHSKMKGKIATYRAKNGNGAATAKSINGKKKEVFAEQDAEIQF